MSTVHENAVNIGFADAEESDIQKASRERSSETTAGKSGTKSGEK